MAEFQFTFKRYEKKFLISEEQCRLLLQRLEGKMVPDKYPHSTITNIYYDTPEFQIIRRSIAKPLYKEKLRLRSYGVPSENSRVFVEIKKKFKGVVYKRRVDMKLHQAKQYLDGKAAMKQKTYTLLLMRKVTSLISSFSQRLKLRVRPTSHSFPRRTTRQRSTLS